MAQIFISYSRADRNFIEQFVPLIRRVYGNESLWFDDDIHGGADWWQTILEEIGRCNLFIYLISNESLESPYCQAELREALRLNKQILPVIIRRLKPPYPGNIDDDLAAVLRRAQYVDMSGGFRDPVTTASLYAAINRLLESNTTTSSSIDPLTYTPTPEPPVPDKKKRDSNITAAYIAGGFALFAAIIAAIIAGIFGLWQGVFADSDDDPLPTTAIVQEQTDTPTGEPTERASDTASLTQTPTETLAIEFVVATLDTQATDDQATADAQATVAARATGYAVGTQSRINETATATRWTDTPTPNITASIEAFRTQQAATVTQVWISSWTDTPTPTNTATITPTATNTPDGTATLIAFRPQNNADWTPVERTIEDVEMVLVPAGCFDMGSDDGNSDEQPVHEVCFDEPFWIDKYEVTKEQYGSVGCSSWSSEPDQPRNCVDWFDASDHCEARGARLPTEAEWEYAARGPDSLVYPWGNEWNPDNANWRDSSPDETFTVGSFSQGASWVGALDLSGNVWEWTSSLYEAYPYEGDHESNSDNSILRVLRGGSFGDTTDGLRSALRGRSYPDVGGLSDGFRCARSY